MSSADYPWRISLHRREGFPRAFVLVDRSDFSMLNLYRWWLVGGRYAGRRDGHGRCIYMHREILGLVPGDGRCVDHINGLTLDNRRVNLRVVSEAENNQNQSAQRGRASRYRGVAQSRASTGWRARYGSVYLGTYDSELDAARAAARYRAANVPYSTEDPALLAGPPPIARYYNRNYSPQKVAA